jgi:integrase
MCTLYFYMGTLRFELRKDKLTSKNTAPISLIYQVAGDRVRIPTNQYTYPCNWDLKDRKAIYQKKEVCSFLINGETYKVPKELVMDTEAVKDINRALGAIESKITDIETVFEKTGVIYTAELVKQKYSDQNLKKHKKAEERGLLHKLIDEFIELNTGSKKPGSIAIYRSTQKHLMDYEKAKRHQVTFENIDTAFFMRFQNYLNFDKEKLLSNTTVGKILKTLKTVINFAKNHKGVIMPAYKGFSIKKEELPVIALSQDEFSRVINLDLSDKSQSVIHTLIHKKAFNNDEPDQKPETISYSVLDKVRDVYVFSSLTGLRFQDLQQLEWDHITDDGAIDLTQMKTSTQVYIPLSKPALAILKKNKDHVKPLITISNQKSNKYIKEVMKLASINDRVERIVFRGNERIAEMHEKWTLTSMHQARRNFITFCLQKGMQERDVASFSGHVPGSKAFGRYVSTNNEYKRSLMKRIWDTETNDDITMLKVV